MLPLVSCTESVQIIYLENGNTVNLFPEKDMTITIIVRNSTSKTLYESENCNTNNLLKAILIAELDIQ